MKLPKSSPRRKMKTPKSKPERGALNESMSSNEKMKPVNLKDGGKVKESGKPLSDADIDRLRRSAAARGLSYSDGKKISDKDLKHLSQNYKDGGAVCSGSGSAMQGTKFRGVR